MITQSLILYQRYSAKTQICKKSFGTLAIANWQTKGLSLSNRTLTSMRTFRENIKMISNGTQLQFQIFSGNSSGILSTRTVPGPRSLFSLIGRAGYILNRDRNLGLLATSGARKGRKKPSFSKVCPSNFQLLPLLTSCRCLRKARG